MVFGFHMTMDNNSLEIRLDGKFIGYRQKHPEREPRVILWGRPENFLTMHQMEMCVAKLKEFAGK